MVEVDVTGYKVERITVKTDDKKYDIVCCGNEVTFYTGGIGIRVKVSCEEEVISFSSKKKGLRYKKLQKPVDYL